MNNSPRMKLLTLCIGAALAQMASLPALADSGVGVDTVIGNAANPGYAAGTPVVADPDSPPLQRTPTGQLYNYPPLKDDVEKGQVTGHVEIGGVVNSSQKANSKRNEYTANSKNGVYLNNFDLGVESEGARYFSVNGGGLGRHDQFYDLSIGKYNSWKVRAFYNETQHVFTETWKSLYNGENTGNMSTGLAMPTIVKSGTYTAGSTNYVGDTRTCTAAAPCWSYNGKVYGGNSTAAAGSTAAQILASQQANMLIALNGVIGTPNATTGAMATATGAGATGATQSNIAAAIAAKLAATPYAELSLVRRKGGVRGDITLTDSVKAYASYSLEDRKGSRPFAMNDGNVSTEIAEPISYKTHDLLAGLSYSDELNQANLRASASMFRNDIKQLNVQYALMGVVTPNGVIQHATIVLPPDNNAFNIKGEFARSLPDLMKGRFTAAASWGTNRQNDALQAPISDAQNADLTAGGVTTLTAANPGYAANTALVSNWNTPNALSRQNAGQRIDNKMVDLGLSLKPVDDLAVKGFYRFYETDNKGGYIAYNPLTGQFGRGPGTGNGTGAFDAVIAPSGVGTGCYTLPGYSTAVANNGVTCSAATLANGSNVPVFGQARSTRQYNFGINADYDLDKFSSLNLAIEREDFNRNFRERARTEEGKLKLGYVNRALGDVTLRVSAEQDRKRGSNYNFRTFEDLGTGLPGLDPATQIANTNPATGAGLTVNGITYPALAVGLFNRYSYFFRKYDQADRNQKIVNTRVNYQVREDMDLGLNLQVKRAYYPEGTYGLKKDNQNSVGVDMNFQPSMEQAVTAFYNYQKGQKTQTMNVGNITAVAAPACTANLIAQYGYSACSDTTTGLDGARSIYDTWTSETLDTNHVLGMGLQSDLGFARLGVDYVYSRSTTHIGYDYGSMAFSATAANNARMAAIAGTALPDMTTLQNTITLNLVKPIDKKTTVRAMYRFDGMRIKDWHYDNVISGKMAAYDAGTLLLDAGPLNYHVNTFGVFLNYKL